MFLFVTIVPALATLGWLFGVLSGAFFILCRYALRGASEGRP
jgi:hypothetical protein